MVGGMENVSFALGNELSQKCNTFFITWGKSQIFLPLFLPLFLIKSLYYVSFKQIDHIYIGDALLAPLGLILKLYSGIKTSITIHGLDIIFDFPGYQFIIPFSVSKLDNIICVSHKTMAECVKRGIPDSKCKVIPWGIYPNEWVEKVSKTSLTRILGINLLSKKILVTVGRLVKRKGVYWFIDNIFPELPENMIYIIVGEGPERNQIESLIFKKELQNRVLLLGKINKKNLRVIYNSADLFIMPNIQVNGTIEGFGMVAIEASSTGLPVIANNIDGISDAIKNNLTGILVPPNSNKSMIQAINTCKLKRSQVRKTTMQNYSWQKVARQYYDILQNNKE